MNPRRSAVRAIAVTTAVVGAVAVAILLQPQTRDSRGSLRDPTLVRRAIHDFDLPSAPKADKPTAPVLIKVSISPEARVKATAMEGRRDLRQGAWSEFTITIDNAAGITAPLVVESEQLMTSDDDTTRDHWLSLSLEPSGPLTGAPTETRILRLRSRDPGIRTAVLNINAGQGTQDLGFRSDVIISFQISLAGEATPFAFHDHGQ